MPGSRQRFFEREVRRWLLDNGATDLRTEPAGRHKRLYFTFAGTERFYTLGTTVRDQRAHYDAIRTIRHMVGMLE